MRNIKALLVASAFLTFTFSVSSVVFAANASILETKGSVQVRVPEGKEWKLAEAGQDLPMGSEILTASESTCLVGIGGDIKSAIRVNPDSRAVILSHDPAHIDLQSGKLFALVRGLKKGSEFRVSTPTAVASARGTGWGQDSQSVDVFESNVDVDAKNGGDQDVPEGDGVHLNPDGSLGDTYKLSQEQIDEWDAFKEDAEAALGAGDDAPDDVMDKIKEDSSESEDQDDIDKALKPEEQPEQDRGKDFFTNGN